MRFLIYLYIMIMWTSSKRDSTSLLLHTYIAVYIQGLYTVYNGAGVHSILYCCRAGTCQEPEVGSL
jgi:hypothetical protein